MGFIAHVESFIFLLARNETDFMKPEEITAFEHHKNICCNEAFKSVAMTEFF